MVELNAEDTRLLAKPSDAPNQPANYTVPDPTPDYPLPGKELTPYPANIPTSSHLRRRTPVDVNAMKRNMSIAKGFLDISLLTANANQLKHVLIYGNNESNTYKVLLVGLSFSLILQIVTGVMLIVKERFNINEEMDQDNAELYNNVCGILIFVTLLINVFISAFATPPNVSKEYPAKVPHTIFPKPDRPSGNIAK